MPKVRNWGMWSGMVVFLDAEFRPLLNTAVHGAQRERQEKMGKTRRERS
jgi:hypothetical protein